MSDFKDIQLLSLPIPEFDKDLNLIRFKAIFNLMQTHLNDVIHNTELVVTGFETHEDRISYSENSIGPSYNVGTEGTIRTRLINLETLKADAASVYTKNQSDNNLSTAVNTHNNAVGAHGGRITDLETKTPQNYKTTDTVQFFRIKVNDGVDPDHTVTKGQLDAHEEAAEAHEGRIAANRNDLNDLLDALDYTEGMW